ncbi:hypothetical protein O181_004828 [Austropuccinia psidii MF-1]|uniref:Uncharacterized protein n=1 Tax=Austropuccinia psidii MF-1 TaxID=1389203 RepID=A0A9Q3GEY9_9BASI|nr:hypothetical protein [Austropuccinia psidii MF-1]
MIHLSEMRISRLACTLVSATTIANCWKHTNILPTSDNNSIFYLGKEPKILEAEKKVGKKSNQLVKLLVVNSKKMMNLDELLNPQCKGEFEQWLPEDIFSANAQENNAANDSQSPEPSNTEKEGAIKKPTAKEAPKVISLMRALLKLTILMIHFNHMLANLTIFC